MSYLASVVCRCLLLTISLVSFTASAQAPAPTPQTGQTSCYSPVGNSISCTGTGQDGDVRAGVAWPSPRFTVSGDCVTDNLTGLMWTRQNYPRGGISWTWQQALDVSAGLSLCGYSDWRLPNVNELESLYNAGVVYLPSWLETQGITLWDYTYDLLHWTSTTVSFNGDVWVVDFGNGFVGPKNGFNSAERAMSFWPVRGTGTGPAPVARTGQTVSYAAGDDGALQAGVPWPDPRFTANGDCITDNLTGLMWSRNANLPGQPMQWEDALAYVEGLNQDTSLCGVTGWRLPNRKETRSLANYATARGAWLAGQGFTNIMDGYGEWEPGSWWVATYWTSTNVLGGGWWEPVMANAFGVNFGDMTYELKFDRKQFVWPVRTSVAAPPPVLSANLSVTVTDAPDPVTVGNNLTYSIAVANAGPDAATGVTLTDALPAGVSLVSAISSQGSCGTGPVVTCSLGTVAAAGNASVTVVVVPTVAGGLSNSVSVTATVADPNSANNTAAAATSVLAPASSYTLTVTKGGTGSGTVTSSPAGISCGADCSEPYPAGTVVTLSATAANGSVFAGWGGNADCTDGAVSMNASKTCKATFRKRR